MLFRLPIAVLCLLAACTPSRAQDLSGLPPYRPARQVDRTLRSWGHGFLKTVMKSWEGGFQKYQPKARFDDNLFSSASAMAGLYSGRADLGVLAREITPPETAAYEKGTRQKVRPITVLTGSYGNPDKIMALGVFVSKDNPIDRLTFSQLDGIFGAEHRRNPGGNVRTWGKLGLAGAWSERTIHPYSGPANEAPDTFFSHAVMEGSVLWNGEMRQYDDLVQPDGKTLDGYRRMIDAAAGDPDAIVLTGAGYRNPGMKLVAISKEDPGPFVLPSRQTVFDRTYPLSRPVKFYIHDGPAIPADPDVVEFLRFVVSREGQELVADDGDFIPLNASEAREQMEILDRIQAALLSVPMAAAPPPAAESASSPAPGPSRDGLEVQKARNRMVESRARTVHYDPRRWDLSGLPSYHPESRFEGAIRLWGNNYIADSTLADAWQQGFGRYHPGVRLDTKGLKSALVATTGLVAGVADIAANRHITFSEVEGFERMFGYDPVEISMARGSYDVPGWMTTFCIIVHKDNPINGLTMRQLDGIFGTARDGGWTGTTWHPEAGRSARENLRTWGDVGLTGRWKDKPIHVYGLNMRYNNCDMFERAVFHGGDKWNETLREYANYSRADGSLAIAATELVKDLGNDPYGIGWSGMQNVTPETKAIALGEHDGGPYVPLTIDSVHDRSYPLAFDMFFYVNRPPGRPLDPKVREFLRYVLSREGQEAVAKDGKYIPLTEEKVRSELAKLE